MKLAHKIEFTLYAVMLFIILPIYLFYFVNDNLETYVFFFSSVLLITSLMRLITSWQALKEHVILSVIIVIVSIPFAYLLYVFFTKVWLAAIFWPFLLGGAITLIFGFSFVQNDFLKQIPVLVILSFVVMSFAFGVQQGSIYRIYDDPVESLAQITKSHSICSLVTYHSQNTCYFGIAKASQDVSVCYEAEENSVQIYCLTNMGEILQDCSLTEGVSKDACLSNLGIRNNDPTLCDQIITEKYADACFEFVAKDLKDGTLCLKISRENGFAKNICLRDVAVRNNDIETCNFITDEEIKSFCIQRVCRNVGDETCVVNT